MTTEKWISFVKVISRLSIGLAFMFGFVALAFNDTGATWAYFAPIIFPAPFAAAFGLMIWSQRKNYQKIALAISFLIVLSVLYLIYFFIKT